MSKLVNGKIPAGKGCPFFKDCAAPNERCPTDDTPKDVDFSCGAARAFDIGGNVAKLAGFTKKQKT